MPDTTCREVTERLPWLLNGSLEPEEQDQLRQHLAGCEACRLETGLTAAVWSDLGTHLPSLALSEYALGVSGNHLPREMIEAHLAACPQCREEYQLVTTDASLEAPPKGRLLDFRRQSKLAWLGEHPLRAATAAVAAAAIVVSIGMGLLPTIPAKEAPTPIVVQREVSEPIVDPHSATSNQQGLLLEDGFESQGLSAWSVHSM